MPLDTIEKSDILKWNSKEDIADTLEKRGLERTNLGEEDEIVMELDEDRFIAIVSASGDRTPSDYNSRMTSTRQTQVVSTDNFEEFTFTTRRRAWDKHGQIKYNRWQITKDQFENNDEVRTPLDKLNNIEYGEPQSINQLYETKKVVNEFYNQFEKIRADMVEKVSGIPDDEGEKKQNYAQTIFDRLIFLHFIQEKKLLDYNPNYLEENHEKVLENGGDVYEGFYKPLFFKWLATDKDHPEDKLPYLNGGLFTRTDVEREYEDVRLGEDTEETNKLYSEILDFLGDWNWHADERLDIVDPNKLSPELLGHIFEKTVNQKEMGAYYTPEEITHFMSRNTIQPYILDRINEEFDKNYEEIDEVFKIPDEVEEESEDEVIIGSVDEIEKEEVEYLYFEVLQDLKVLDPAVGSGAFLLAAQEVLIDIYMSALQYFQDLDEEASWEMTERIEKVVTEVEENAGEDGSLASESMHAKRQIILNNLYGVDIDKGATEICKLRLWLSIVADLEKGDNPHKVETLPNIDFNIRQGNSLIGFTEPIEKALDDDIEDEKSQANLNQYSPDAIHKKYDEIIKKIKTYKEHEKEGNGEKAEQARQDVFKLLEEYREDPDEKILQQFHEAGIEDVDMDDIKEFSPFHWVLEFAEVYSEGGFAVIIGNPPWDKVKAERTDFFPRYDELFRTKTPNEKKKIQNDLLEDEEIEEEWEEYQKRVELLSKYFNESTDYNLQSAEIDGRTESTENDLSALFLERVLDLQNEEAYIAKILPGETFTGASRKNLREKLLDENEIESLIGFENRGIFDNIDNRYKFDIVTFSSKGETTSLKGSFMNTELDVLKQFSSIYLDISRPVLENYSPTAKIFPNVRSEEELRILEKVIQYEPISRRSAWYAEPYRELDRSKDTDRFVEKKEGDYPVLGGSNIYSFYYNNELLDLDDYKFWSVEEQNEEKSAHYRIREKKWNSYNLVSAIYEKFEGTGSSKTGFANELLKKKRGSEVKMDDIKLDCSEYRIVYRNSAQPTDERTMLSAVIPKDYVCHNALQTVKPFELNPKEEDLEKDNLKSTYKRIFTDRELFVCLGLMNSLPFDFIIRTKADKNLVQYKFKETQVPKLEDGDEWFNFISERAARLNCYGEEFEEMRERLGDIDAAIEKCERNRIQAEIDAAAFHAYGLSRDETKYVLDNFHRVGNPRVMTEDYFDMVLEKFDELNEEGPFE